MRIIHDVYQEEIQFWFKGPGTGDAVQFSAMYGYLRANIDFESQED